MSGPAIAIVASVPRRRVAVAGEVESVVTYEHPGCEPTQCSTTEPGVTLRFLGRSGVPGFSPAAVSLP